jgi:hypothetical protein
LLRKGMAARLGLMVPSALFCRQIGLYDGETTLCRVNFSDHPIRGPIEARAAASVPADIPLAEWPGLTVST